MKLFRWFAGWLCRLMALFPIPPYVEVPGNLIYAGTFIRLSLPTRIVLVSQPEWRDLAALLHGQPISEARKVYLKAKLAELGG